MESTPGFRKKYTSPRISSPGAAVRLRRGLVIFTEKYSDWGYSGKRCSESDWNEIRDRLSKKKDSFRPRFFTDRSSTTPKKVSPDRFRTDFTVILCTVIRRESKVEECFWMRGSLPGSLVTAGRASSPWVPDGEGVPDGEIPPGGEERQPERTMMRMSEENEKIV